MKSVAKSVLAATLALGLAQAAAAQVPGVTDTEIRIGTFGPITGGNYVFGKHPMNGLELIFKKVNDAGGVHGRKLTLVRQDDQCDPANSIASVRRLIHTEKVFAIVGGSCSNGVIAAKPDIIEAKIPFINFAAASALISTPKQENIFTTMLTSHLESKLQARYLKEQNKSRIAVVSIRDAWGRDRYDTLIAALKEQGLQVVADEEISNEVNDATAQVLRVRAANPDGVVILNYPKPSAIFLRDAARLGFKSLFIGTSAIPDPVAFYEQVNVPGATDNFLTISPSRYAITSENAKEWRDRLAALLPDERPHGYHLYGIVAGQVLVAALEAAGRDLTQAKLIAALDGLKGFASDVAPGPLTCAGDHQCLKAASWIRRSPDGKIEILSQTALH
jgi:branched-chain amino acid transport system substrate-binding protein